MNVAIIPARGGSKGVPGKNLCKVGGVPLIVRTIIAARDAEWIHTVCVSTDNANIQSVAQDAGADVVFRPPELARDESTSEQALLHALCKYPSAVNMAFLQCTSPFTTSAEIDACMKMLDDGYDSVFTVAETHAGYWTEGLQCISHNAGIQRKGRQLTRPLLRETGGIYAMRVQRFIEAGNRFFGKMGTFAVSERSAFEVDSPFDLRIANAMAEVE